MHKPGASIRKAHADMSAATASFRAGRGGGGGAWGTAGGRGQQRGEGINGGGGNWGGGAWGGAGAGMMSSPGGPGATVLESALSALFGGEAVSGVKGKRNMEVRMREEEEGTRVEDSEVRWLISSRSSHEDAVEQQRREGR